jgi:hypothetical protein
VIGCALMGMVVLPLSLWVKFLGVDFLAIGWRQGVSAHSADFQTTPIPCGGSSLSPILKSSGAQPSRADGLPWPSQPHHEADRQAKLERGCLVD